MRIQRKTQKEEYLGRYGVTDKIKDFISNCFINESSDSIYLLDRSFMDVYYFSTKEAKNSGKILKTGMRI